MTTGNSGVKETILNAEENETPQVEETSQSTPVEPMPQEQLNPEPPPQQPVQQDLSVDEQIQQLETEQSGVRYSRPKSSKLEVDRFKNDSGRLTFFYKNISPKSLSMGSDEKRRKQMPLWKPGELVNFLHYYDEEDIINHRDIKSLENPMNGPPKIRRLTPAEYLNEYRKQQELQQKRNAVLQQNREDITKKPIDETVKDTVQNQVSQLLTYEGYTDEQKRSSVYTKYDFIEWLRGYVFNAEEYRFMSVQVKDGEIQRELLDRKLELNL